MGLVRRLSGSSLGIKFKTEGCHEIPDFSPCVPGCRREDEDGVVREHVLGMSSLSSARAQLHEKVSPRLRASHHSSEPPGAAGRRANTSNHLHLRADLATRRWV